jgi:hypothetical protein
MDKNTKKLDIETCIHEGPQSALERNLLEEYLREKGYTLQDLQKLPEAEARQLMSDACTYVSLRLTEIESKSHFRDSIRSPT